MKRSRSQDEAAAEVTAIWWCLLSVWWIRGEQTYRTRAKAVQRMAMARGRGDVLKNFFLSSIQVYCGATAGRVRREISNARRTSLL